MKIGMYGPDWPQRVYRPAKERPAEPQDEPAFEVAATTLAEALSAWSERFGACLRPYDGSLPYLPFGDGPPRYFFYESATRDQLVDVHVLRDGENICPKQDLGFALLEGDVVRIGELVC